MTQESRKVPKIAVLCSHSPSFFFSEYQQYNAFFFKIFWIVQTPYNAWASLLKWGSEVFVRIRVSQKPKEKGKGPCFLSLSMSVKTGDREHYAGLFADVGSTQ